MALSAGTRLGPYEILAPLGAGGMGEVYRARDPRLDRDVAIKVLPEGVASEPDRLRRFEREARAAGGLNHPNILDVHDVGTHEARPYVVTELLEGETLRERLQAGALPVREAVGCAVQIARGLGAAHEKGIIHRDLKPDNLFVTKDGRVKILDFGLVKLTPGAPPTRGSDVTEPTAPATESGAVLGTVGYVSPEQIRGQAVDHRTDIFGFGAVLYEMLSGRRAFRGETPTETLAAILKEDPPELAREGRGIPLALARIAHRCLEKRPEQRFHSAEDVAFALEALSDAPAAPGPLGERGRRRWPLLASLAVAAALGVGGTVWLLVSGGAPSEPVAAAHLVPLTNLRGFEDHPALSPDGSRVAFSWNGETGADHEIYVKQIGTDTLLRLTRDPGDDLSPTWSPDGSHIAFSRRTESEVAYFVVPALGGPERRVHTFPGHGRRPAFVDWSPDGKSLALTDSSAGGPAGIALLSLDTLETVPLVASPEFVRGLAFSRDGRRLAFVQRLASNQAISDIYVVPVAGGEPRRLTFDNRGVPGLAWTRDGREIVFSSHRAGLPRLWRMAASGGTPEPVTWGGEGAWHVSIARDADRLAYVRRIHDNDIWKVEVDGSGRGGGRSVAVLDSTAGDLVPHMSPDGSRIAFASDRSGLRQIWVCDADGSSCMQLYSDPGGSPRWSPDGREVAFDGGPEATAGIFVVDVQTRAVRPLARNPSDDVLPSWSADGRWVYFASNRSGSWQVWKTPAEGGRAVPVTTEGGFQALESPDGQFLYFSRTMGAADIWRRATAGGEETPMLEFPPGCWRCWDVGEAGLYYLNTEAQPRPAIELFDPVTGEVTRVAGLEGTPSTGAPNLAVSADGRSILYVQVERDEHDLMLIENFR